MDWPSRPKIMFKAWAVSFSVLWALVPLDQILPNENCIHSLRLTKVWRGNAISTILPPLHWQRVIEYLKKVIKYALNNFFTLLLLLLLYSLILIIFFFFYCISLGCFGFTVSSQDNKYLFLDIKLAMFGANL